MPDSLLHNLKLKPLIFSFLNESAGYHQVRELISVSHKLAVAYLKIKIIARKIDFNTIGITPDEFAYDSIAELFSSDHSDDYPKIKTYFQKIFEGDAINEEELLSHLRRLIFSAVNDNIFRVRKFQDPALAKIIRNLKDVVNFKTKFKIKKVWNETYIDFDNEEVKSPLPLYPSDLLVVKLNGNISNKNLFETFILTIGELLNSQNDYRKEYPLLGLAYILRDYFMIKNMSIEENEDHKELHSAELQLLLSEAQAVIKKNIGEKYINSGKFTPDIWDCYEKTIHDILTQVFIEDTGLESNYFNFLLRYLPNLTFAEYQKFHKTKMEYLIRLSKNRFLEIVQKEIQFQQKSIPVTNNS